MTAVINMGNGVQLHITEAESRSIRRAENMRIRAVKTGDPFLGIKAMTATANLHERLNAKYGTDFGVEQYRQAVRAHKAQLESYYGLPYEQLVKQLR